MILMVEQQSFSAPYNLLVGDPSASTRMGDVVSIQNGWRTGRIVRHVVSAIIAPMGPPLSERPPVPSEVERVAAAEAKRFAKDVRQAARGRSAAVDRIKAASKADHIEKQEAAKIRFAEKLVKQAENQKTLIRNRELPEETQQRLRDKAKARKEQRVLNRAVRATVKSLAQEKSVKKTDAAPIEQPEELETSPASAADTQANEPSQIPTEKAKKQPKPKPEEKKSGWRSWLG